MDYLVERITDYCITHDIVEPDQASWFRYGIAKRLSTLFSSVPLLAIAVLLTSFEVSVAYYLSFAIIRRRTNGYHAKSWIACLFISIAIVAVFLGLIYPLLTRFISFVVATTCVLLVFLLAPYDHELMHFTRKEYIACQKYSRISICITAFIALLLYSINFDSIASALITGMATAVFLLCLGHISDWRNKHGKQEAPA